MTEYGRALFYFTMFPSSNYSFLLDKCFCLLLEVKENNLKTSFRFCLNSVKLNTSPIHNHLGE